MGSSGNHCSFVLLAEFHIFEGAQLKYQFPQPLGIDENVLAMSMLPDGAETQLDDWTIFFLNQTPFNTISPVLALDTPEVNTVELPGEDGEGSGGTKPELLCVLNLVRTKHDKALDRGAKVLALAICTRHPFIQIFKPFLLMALDDYFLDPSQDCLARLFDAVNSLDLTGAPILTRQEKLVMRSSERKDIFAEKFINSPGQFSNWNQPHKPAGQHKSTNSAESYSSFEEGLLMRNKDKGVDENRGKEKDSLRSTRDRADTESSVTTAVSSTQELGRDSPSDASSFSLGGSAVWVGDDSGLEIGAGPGPGPNASSGANSGDTGSVSSNGGSHTMAGSTRKRSSTDASSSSHSHNPHRFTSNTNLNQPGLVKDTHFYHTVVAYKDHPLPIKMPLATFPEEVGDYSLIKLVKLFSSPSQVSGPIHPHLHTNGPQTHPIIILFNALVTGKRVIFLGHKQPAGEVSSFVLSACALASGCGAVLRGFIERAFPYANLKNRDDWEGVPAYIAGVTNPIFESSRAWDVLLDIGSGSVKVANDIHVTYPPVPNPIFSGVPLLSRAGTLKAEGSIGSEDDIGRANTKDGGSKSDFAAKAMDNNADRIFIEDIKTAIEDHFSESLVRLRFTEYAMRFVRLAARFEEEVAGSTKLGFSSAPFVDGTAGRPPQLGSGIVFPDESMCLRELHANAPRIEAWRKTNTYKYCVMDFAKTQANNAIKGIDIGHQLLRLRHAKIMSDAEVSAIARTLADNVKNYEQAVELLANLMPHAGGLTHLGFGLFHQRETVRDATVDLFNQLRQYPVGITFLQALNHFQRYAYVRQAHVREKKLRDGQQPQSQGQSQAPSQPLQQPFTPPQQYQQSNFSRAHSNSFGKSHSSLTDRSNGAPF